MSRTVRRRLVGALAALLVVAGLAGCASVPQSSSVQVLRKVTDGEAPALPPGPVDGSNPLDLVRGFVYASGSSIDRHAAARRFLSPQAQNWDDSSGLTVLGEQFDTVYPPVVIQSPVDTRIVRIRGTRIGTLGAAGAFQPDEAPVEVDVTVVRRDGQWRIDRLPGGVLVRLSDFSANYRTVRTYFADPVRGSAVADLRYLPTSPARAQASRAVELLLAGPSAALENAVVSVLTPTARLRSNVAEAPDGAVVVDLTGVGDLDQPSRRLLAAQVVLSLAEVNVVTVRLLVDGTPLLTGKPDLTRDDVAGLGAEVAPGAEVPGFVVAGGRLRQLTGPEPGAPVPGPAGSGAVEVASAAVTLDGQRLAVVSRQAGRVRLLVGPREGELRPAGLDAATMTRPTWTSTGSEVWTVLGGSTVARMLVDDTGTTRAGQVDVAELAALGPIDDLRLSRDGLRVAAVVGDRLVTAAVDRRGDGGVAVRNARMLRSADLGQVVAVAWRTADSVLVISGRSDRPVSLVSVDGLSWQLVPSSNLTPPLRAGAAAPSRPLLAADQGGVWSFSGGELDTWRQVLGGVPDAVPVYPG